MYGDTVWSNLVTCELSSTTITTSTKVMTISNHNMIKGDGDTINITFTVTTGDDAGVNAAAADKKVKMIMLINTMQ